jgi:tetratricopeptide (TPR) repeat protein
VDIWAWVYRTEQELREAGQGRLADLIDAIPRAVVANENDEVAAMVPEALGLARALNLPWVEIFVRHWDLQARGGGLSTLDDAVELLEFSHREEHIACPQSVCTVQDLARAYAGVDGPGYGQERLDVSSETLDRIDHSWPCFSCIVSERAAALVDLERHEEALAFVERSRGLADIEAHSDEADALLALGRPEEALRRLDAADRRDPRPDDTFGRRRRLRRVLALLALGRAEEADEALLPFDLVMREPAFAEAWARGLAGLVDAGRRPNDWRVGSALERLLGILVERGRVWEAVRLAAIHGRLALERGARSTAEHAAAAGRDQADRLRDPERGRAELAALERALEAAADGGEPLPDTAEALLEQLGADDDPDAERHAELLVAACRRWPDSLELVEALAGALAALGRVADGGAALRAYADRHPDDAEAWSAAGQLAIAARDRQALDDAVERLETTSPPDAAWLRALMADELGDHSTAAAEARRVVELDPEAMNARRLLVHAAKETGDWGTALEHVELLLERAEGEEAEDLHWTRLVVATPLDAWDVVRESARAVGMTLEPGSEPIDERWGVVRLSFGPREVLTGVRTGPATARVVQIAPPGSPQRAGAVALIEPTPLNPEAGDDEPHVLPVRAELAPSAMRSYAFDAVDPGDEAWDAFRDRADAEGWLVNTYDYRDDFELTFEGAPCRGLYGYIAVPQDTTAREVHARLTELAAPLPRPMIWPRLAEEAGDDAAGCAQRGLAAAVGLIPD